MILLVCGLLNIFNSEDSAISAGKKVLVHCQVGQSRSPSIIIAYLMKKNGISYDQAFSKVKEARAVIRPNSSIRVCSVLTV